MQCPNCQQVVPDTANVCGYCGTRLRAPAPIQSPPPTPPAAGSVQAAPPLPAPVQPTPLPQPVYIPPVPPALAPRRRGIPIWLWIIAILFCLFVTAVLVWVVFFSDINIVLGS